MSSYTLRLSGISMNPIVDVFDQKRALIGLEFVQRFSGFFKLFFIRLNVFYIGRNLFFNRCALGFIFAFGKRCLQFLDLRFRIADFILQVFFFATALQQAIMDGRVRATLPADFVLNNDSAFKRFLGGILSDTRLSLVEGEKA